MIRQWLLFLWLSISLSIFQRYVCSKMRVISSSQNTKIWRTTSKYIPKIFHLNQMENFVSESGFRFRSPQKYASYITKILLQIEIFPGFSSTKNITSNILSQIEDFTSCRTKSSLTYWTKYYSKTSLQVANFSPNLL